MHATSLIIFVMSHSGYWLAGTDGTVSVRWTVPHQTPRATLVWELSIDSIRLNGGSISMNPEDRSTDITIKCPDVRVRTDLKLHYRLLSPGGKPELCSGDQIVHAFPADLSAGWSRLLADKSVAVVDSPDGLPGLLARVHVAFTRLNHVADLQLGHPDLVLVGANQLDDSPFSQGFVIEHARAGAAVILFEQSRVNRLIGFAVALRARPPRLEWMSDHPLLAGLNAQDLDSWLGDLPTDVPTVRLPSDTSAVSIAGWRLDRQGAAEDSLVSIQRVGRGHIVLCQLRLGSWNTDPRTVLLVGNMLDYVSGTTEPDRRSFCRHPSTAAEQARATSAADILIPAGDDR